MSFFKEIAKIKHNRIKKIMRQGRYNFIRNHGYQLNSIVHYSDSELKLLCKLIYIRNYRLSEEQAERIVK